MAGWKRARRINTYYRRLCIVDGLSIQPRWWRYMVIHLKIIEPVPPYFSVCHWKFIESLMYGALSGGPMASYLCPTRGLSRRVQVIFATIYGGQFWNIVPIMRSQTGHCAVSKKFWLHVVIVLRILCSLFYFRRVDDK